MPHQDEVTTDAGWIGASPGQPHQTAFATAGGLIEPPEPGDTTLAQARPPRFGAAGVSLSPGSHLWRRSAWPHRRRGLPGIDPDLQVQSDRPHGRTAACSVVRFPAYRQHRCRKWSSFSAPYATVCHSPLPRRCWPGERSVRQSQELGRFFPPENSHEGRAGQRVHLFVRGKQKQPRRESHRAHSSWSNGACWALQAHSRTDFLVLIWYRQEKST